MANQSCHRFTILYRHWCWVCCIWRRPKAIERFLRKTSIYVWKKPINHIVYASISLLDSLQMIDGALYLSMKENIGKKYLSRKSTKWILLEDESLRFAIFCLTLNITVNASFNSTAIYWSRLSSIVRKY